MSEDTQWLRKIVRMCFNDDYKKAMSDEIAKKNERSKRRNKATFTTTSTDEDGMENQAELAFRKSAMKALNQEKILLKKIELHKYIEELRKTNN